MEQRISNIKNILYKPYFKLLIQALILLIPSIFVWIVFYPGYFQADHQSLIANILIYNSPRIALSPIWGYLSAPFFYIFNSYSAYGIIQIIVYTICVIISSLKLKKCKIIKDIWIFTLVMALFPTFLMYNLLYSSQMITAYLVILLTAYLIEYSYSKNTITKWYYLQLFLIITFVCLMRKTALLIPFLLILFFIIFNTKENKKIIVIAIFSVVCTLLINSFFNIITKGENNDSNVFAVAMPSYQISAVYSEGGKILDEDREIFESMKSETEWKSGYNIACSDSSRMNVVPTLSFFHSYFRTGINNVTTYIKAYWKIMKPFFVMYEKSTHSRDNGTEIDFGQHDEFTLDYFKNNINNQDLLHYKDQFGVQHSNIWYSLSSKISNLHNKNLIIIDAVIDLLILNRALPLWTLIIGLIITIANKKWKQYILICVPIASILIVYLAFCPIVLFRYTAEMYYALPVIYTYLIYCTKKSIHHKKISMQTS